MATLQRDLERGERPAERVDLEHLWRAPPGGPGARRSDSRADPVTWNRRLIVAWLALLVGVVVFQPTPNASAALPVWAEVIGFLFSIGLVASIATLASGHPGAIGFSGATALLGFGMAVTCGLTDHHPAAWWGTEMAVTGALVGMHYLALRSIRRGGA
ncbi:MAG: hypothetical protein ACRDKZ_11800 [Actinomycetota bacterium]